MTPAALGYFAVSDRWPSWVLAAGVLGAAVGWLWLHRLAGALAGAFGAGRAGPTGGLRRWMLTGGRVLLAFGGIWLAFQVLGRMFVLATNWAIWPVAAVAAAGAEAIVWLYALERRIVSRRMGLLLTALRLGLLAIIAVMLIQPVLVSIWSETNKRTLAVLVDTSASMGIADRQMPAHQKLRLAEGFCVPAARRPYHLEDSADRLRAVRRELLHELAWLDRLAQGKRQTVRQRLAQRRKELHKKFSAEADAVAKQCDTAGALLEEMPDKLPKSLQADLRSVRATLSREVRPVLLDAAGWTQAERGGTVAQDLDRTRKGLHRAVKDLAKAAPLLERVGVEVDKALYAKLSPTDRSAVDAVARLSRLELARAALLHRPVRPDEDEPAEALLAQLADQYNVKIYTFAGTLAEVNVRDWTDPIPSALAGAESASGATSRPAGRGQTSRPAENHLARRTDLAAALGKALAGVGRDDLAGVLMLSDGQDNGSVSAEPLARQLGGRGSGLCAIMVGAQKPPTDAAIISVEAPQTVYLKDRMFITADVKLDGLAGREARVSLYDGANPVDFKTIRPAGDVFRRRIRLADEPRKPGLHHYRVRIEPCRGEVFTDNNSYPLTLSVTDEKTKVLLVDSRPRWEFRYLKNLFSGRDKTVRLQYVLLQPDRFFGQPARPKILASASRPASREEATLLPENEQEWLKFDVIVLGDLSPKDLSGQHARSIRRFVADRGGTLIVICGPRHMPQQFAGTALAELIPVKLPQGPDGKTAKKTARAGALPSGGYRIALTPEGAGHVLLRQHVQPDKSLRIWQSAPPLFWRSAWAQATPVATVLAYALDRGAPKWLTGQPAGGDSSPEKLAKRREEYRRAHALIMVAPHGLGKVMLLTFDRTWRLRYRVGDTYHHKFWGQVLRWATAGKLPVGTHLVKLGTDKTRYGPKDRPVVRAKIVREDLSPVVTDQVAVKVLSGKRLIGRVPMRYVKDSPGMYTATLDALAAGTYRLELDCPQARALLKRDGAETISTGISVDPSAPAEEIELAANRDLLERLASLSHNGVVVRPYQARRVLDCLPAGKMRQKHRMQLALWDSWVLFALFCGAVTAEWLLRKRVGLS